MVGRLRKSYLFKINNLELDIWTFRQKINSDRHPLGKWCVRPKAMTWGILKGIVWKVSLGKLNPDKCFHTKKNLLNTYLNYKWGFLFFSISFSFFICKLDNCGVFHHNHLIHAHLKAFFPYCIHSHTSMPWHELYTYLSCNHLCFHTTTQWMCWSMGIMLFLLNSTKYSKSCRKIYKLLYFSENAHFTWRTAVIWQKHVNLVIMDPVFCPLEFFIFLAWNARVPHTMFCYRWKWLQIIWNCILSIINHNYWGYSLH